MTHRDEIRRLLDLFEDKQHVMEAQDYAAMFNDVKKLSNNIKETFKNSPEILDLLERTDIIGPISDMTPFISNIVSMAKSGLVKNDRIVWFLRYVKFAILESMATVLKNVLTRVTPEYDGHDALQKTTTDVSNYYLKLITEFNKKSGQSMTNFDLPAANISQIQRKLEIITHFLSLPIDKIQNTVFLYQTFPGLVSQLKAYEKEWQSRAKELIPHDPDDGAVIMTFPDGFMWVNLERSFCKVEGEAMGHCGNSASYKSDDRVFSLRKTIEENGKKFVRPSLTFIVDEDGVIGEMKGRNNQKPDKKYHPYIVALLKSDEITAIKGGGYAPENNFSINDLPEKTRNELLALKPDLGTLSDFAKIYGMDSPKFIRRLDSAVEAAGYNFNYDHIDGDTVILSEYKEFDDFTRKEYSDDILEWLYSVMTGDEEFSDLTQNQDITFDDVRDLIDGLNTDEYTKLMNELGLDAVPHNDTSRYQRNLRQASEEFIRNRDMMDTFTGLVAVKTNMVPKIARDWFMKYIEIGIYFAGNAWVDIDKTNPKFPVAVKIDLQNFVDILSSADAGDDDYNEDYYEYRNISEYGWAGDPYQNEENTKEDRKSAKLPTTLKKLKEKFGSVQLDSETIIPKDYSRAFAREYGL